MKTLQSKSKKEANKQEKDAIKAYHTVEDKIYKKAKKIAKHAKKKGINLNGLVEISNKLWEQKLQHT